MTTAPLPKPLIFAHRGASQVAPENTAIALQIAAQEGARWVEVDLHLTADRKIIVIHNETVDKTTDGHGRVLDMTAAQLFKLDAGSWFANEFVGQRLLSLEQLIDLLVRFDLNVNLEIKSELGVEQETSEIIAKILKKQWPANKLLPLMSSFSPVALRAIKAAAPRLPRGLLLKQWQTDSAALATELECVTVNLARSQVNAVVVQEIKALEKKILVYTVNQLDEAL